MSELEKVWLESRQGRESLLTYQCLALFFDMLGTDKAGTRQAAQLRSHLDSLLGEIGTHLGLRPHEVSQLLQTAWKQGTLTASAPLAVATGIELQRKLEQRLNRPSLCVIVGEVKNRYLPRMEDRVSAVADAAADYFVNVVPQRPLATEKEPDPTSGWIGVSGGNTMLNVVQRIKGKGKPYEGLKVIPLAGEAEPDKFEISANSVVLRLAEVCRPGGADKRYSYSLMTTPIVGMRMAIGNLWEAMEKNPGISGVIALAKHVKFAFTGIGAKSSQEDALARLAKYCGIADPIPETVVGDICYRPIDENGKDAWPELSSRLVGPTLDYLRSMSQTAERRVFAVACGPGKAKAIIAAIRGGLVNGLITDEMTALEILQRLEQPEEEPQQKRPRSPKRRATSV